VQASNDVQAHVDAGGDARRTDDPAVIYEAPIGVNLCLGSYLPEKVHGHVVGGRFESVEQTGTSQEE
jgi:hypothetical protein